MFVVNIISKSKGAAYAEVALNRFPIVYINDEVDGADGLFDDDDFKRILLRYVNNAIVFDNASVCVRELTEGADGWQHQDSTYVLNEKITKQYYGEFVKSNMGDGSK